MTTYTPAQAEAIACLDEPLQIIACAGSGKTQVISQRIAAILAQPGVEPRNVIAFTFTEKAAAELKERVLSIVERELGDVTGLAEMYIGTMHGYCLDLLQRLVPETFKFSVLTDITAQLFVDRNSAQVRADELPDDSDGNGVLRRYINSKLYLQVVSVLREDKIDFDRVPAGVIESFEKYMTLLHENSLFDYTQIINRAVDYLEGDRYEDDDFARVQDHIRDDIRYVVVDEYQDVNPLQERLVRGLVRFGANLCVVGDDDQTIYQWRGSQVSNIVTFASRYAGVRQVTLDDNFRSSEGVVELGRSVAERIPAGERLPKAMVAAGHQTWERGDLLALTFDDPEAEAAWICRPHRAPARRRRSGTAPTSEPRGLSWSDCAVLFRSVAKDSEPVVAETAPPRHPVRRQGPEPALRQPGDPGRRRHLPLHGRRDRGRAAEGALGRGRAAPVRRDWATALKVLETAATSPRTSGTRSTTSSGSTSSSSRRSTCARTRFPATPTRGELVFYQLGKFSQVISDFEQIYFTTEPKAKYEAFAKWLEHQAPDYYADADADVGYATPDAVTIATVHQAKGMQWPAVFLPALRKNRFPSRVHGRRHAAARHPGRRDRRPGPLPRHGRGRDAPVLRRGDPRAEVPVRDVLTGRRQPAAAEPLGLLRPHRRAAVGLDDLGADHGRDRLTPQPGTRRRRSRCRSRS